MNRAVGYKCTKCGKPTYPKRDVCLKCGGREFAELQFPKTATIIAFTNVHQLPWGINERFLTLGVCEFENGLKAMGRITAPTVKKGQKVKAHWKLFREMAGEDVWGWIFEPTR